MSRGDDEVDGTGGEGRIAGAHQLFGSFALSLAVDDWLAAIREAGTRATRAGFIVIGHRAIVAVLRRNEKVSGFAFRVSRPRDRDLKRSLKGPPSLDNVSPNAKLETRTRNFDPD